MTPEAGVGKVADLSVVRHEGALALEGTGGSEVPASIALVNRKGEVVGTYALGLASDAPQTRTARSLAPVSLGQMSTSGQKAEYARLQGMNINVGQLLA
ncbi:MAG TPA: hypothetical protein VHX38_08310 [Pseudonocardiaceae bacterium]|jgi:hypothetical protein|nr:hypothetical protein [Pseudonocardiaceae bacterium]